VRELCGFHGHRLISTTTAAVGWRSKWPGIFSAARADPDDIKQNGAQPHQERL
jgi:hypothetical protein